ncbi:MAG: hypothetical protein ACR2IE_16790 [Candidatus Sumerlaeaceae bacterium]
MQDDSHDSVPEELLVEPIETTPAAASLLGGMNAFLSAIVGGVAGTLTGISGYLLAANSHSQLGLVVFLLIPFISGFTIAVTVQRGRALGASALLTAIATGLFLLWSGLEGIVCLLMSSPNLIIGMAIGIAVGVYVRDRMRISAMMLLPAGLLLAGAARFERGAILHETEETFLTTTRLPVSPEVAWDLIASVHEMSGPRPFLLWLGLPIPDHCTIDRPGVGGTRTCYFNNGTISQTITDWNYPASFSAKVTGWTLPGRHWLKLIGASYNFVPHGYETEVVRQTSISSRLGPRWYWRFFEEMGVQAEHEYVLSDLARRIKELPH